MGIIDSLKTTKDLVVSVHDAELKAQLLAPLVDALLQASQLLEEKRELKERIRELEKIEDIEKDLQLTDKGVYVSKSTGHTYCGSCWGMLQKLIPVIQIAAHTPTGQCTHTKCSSRYPDLFPVSEEPQQRTLERG